LCEDCLNLLRNSTRFMSLTSNTFNHMLSVASDEFPVIFLRYFAITVAKHDKRDGGRNFEDTRWPQILVPRLNASSLLIIIIFTTFPSTIVLYEWTNSMHHPHVPKLVMRELPKCTVVSRTEWFPLRSEITSNLFGHISTLEWIVHSHSGVLALHLRGRSVRSCTLDHTGRSDRPGRKNLVLVGNGGLGVRGKRRGACFLSLAA